jgi:hypothetical protein
VTAGAWRTLPWWRHRAVLLRRRVGRRGAALLVFAFIDLTIGWSLVEPESRAQAQSLPSYQAMLAVAPFAVWGWLWITVGLVCAAQAPARFDRVGYGAAIGIKVVWAGCFLASWLIYAAPRAWLGAATWAVVAALVFLVAGWPEPPTTGGEKARSPA